MNVRTKPLRERVVIKRGPRVPMAAMAEVTREVERCCRVHGLPGFADCIKIRFVNRLDAIAAATSPWRMEHHGKMAPAVSRRGQPTLTVAWPRWRPLARYLRLEVIAHETCHLIADLKWRNVSAHGRRWTRLVNECGYPAHRYLWSD